MTAVRAPFKLADLRDVERIVAAVGRIESRHDDYDDYDFDPVNQIRAAAYEAIREMCGE